MAIKADKWIKRMALEHKMIEPFEDRQVQVRRDFVRVVVVRLRHPGRRRVQGLHQRQQRADRPQELRSQVVCGHQGRHDHRAAQFFRPGASDRVLPHPARRAHGVPRQIHHARCGIIVNVTPFEPEWEGTATLEISNTTPLPAKVYANEGIAQVLFFQSDEVCEVSYGDKKGKYPQAARGYPSAPLASSGSGVARGTRKLRTTNFELRTFLKMARCGSIEPLN